MTEPAPTEGGFEGAVVPEAIDANHFIHALAREGIMFRVTWTLREVLRAMGFERPPDTEGRPTVRDHAASWWQSQRSAHDSCSNFLMMTVWWMTFKFFWVPFQRFLQTGVMVENKKELVLLVIDKEKQVELAREALKDDDACVLHDLSTERNARKAGLQGTGHYFWCVEHGEIVVTAGLFVAAMKAVFVFDFSVEDGPAQKLLQLIMGSFTVEAKTPSAFWRASHIVGTWPEFRDKLQGNGEFAEQVASLVNQCRDNGFVRKVNESLTKEMVFKEFLKKEDGIRAAIRREKSPGCNDKVMVFDFDKTLTTTTLESVESADAALFDGWERVTSLTHHLGELQEMGAKLCVLTRNDIHLVSTALSRVDLLKFFENRVYQADDRYNKVAQLSFFFDHVAKKNICVVDDNGKELEDIRENLPDVHRHPVKSTRGRGGLTDEDFKELKNWFLYGKEEKSRKQDQEEEKASEEEEAHEETRRKGTPRPHFSLKDYRSSTTPLPRHRDNGTLNLQLSDGRFLYIGDAIDVVLLRVAEKFNFVVTLTRAVASILFDVDGGNDVNIFEGDTVRRLLNHVEHFVMDGKLAPLGHSYGSEEKKEAATQEKKVVETAMTQLKDVLDKFKSGALCDEASKNIKLTNAYWALPANVMAANFRNDLLIHHGQRIKDLVSCALAVPALWLVRNTEALDEHTRMALRNGNVDELLGICKETKGVTEAVVEDAIKALANDDVKKPPGGYDGRGCDVSHNSTTTKAKKYVDNVVRAVYNRKCTFGEVACVPKILAIHKLLAGLFLSGTTPPFEDEIALKKAVEHPGKLNLVALRKEAHGLKKRCERLLEAMAPQDQVVHFAFPGPKGATRLRNSQWRAERALRNQLKRKEKTTGTRARFAPLTQSTFQAIAPYVGDEVARKHGPEVKSDIEKAFAKAVYEIHEDGRGGSLDSTAFFLKCLGVSRPKRIQRPDSRCSFCHRDKCRRVVGEVQFRGEELRVSWKRTCERLKHSGHQVRRTNAVFTPAAATPERRSRNVAIVNYFTLQLRNTARDFESLPKGPGASAERRRWAALALLKAHERYKENDVDDLRKKCLADERKKKGGDATSSTSTSKRSRSRCSTL